MAGRMSNKLMILCTVAVGAIYSAGYAVTESSAQTLPPSGTAAALTAGGQTGSNQSPAGSSSTPSKPSSSQSASNSTSSTTPPSSSNNASQNSSKGTSAAKTSQPTTPKYHDGTFQGSGTNPYGTVAVSLTVKQGKITSVQITQCTTHYPESVIDPVLPQEVIKAQTWRIYIVSGATASTYAFAEAVYNALQQAKK
ncbi:FMN-binding protein [Alicyclobacillus tolerans]|uniref:FMN-binding protein n=1 Tax=Alicyclobacillus tolerans TaxID=90970 RepID=UPI001F009005|nr:FMN-binding protein [Alicyclobacillus tolerans]MCF8564230.1 FMN-binding protein [Alicyclobacillus tolerans]